MDNVKQNNIHIMGIPDEEENEQGIKNLFEDIMTENFPKLMKEKDTQFPKLRVPDKLDPKKPIPRHIIIKMTRLQDKERILKATREKQVVTYKRAPIRLSSDFSTETFQARRDWHEIFKVMKSKDHTPGYFTQ